MLRDAIVLGQDDEHLRDKLMQNRSDLTLDQCIELCRTAELTKTQLYAMSTSNAVVDTVRKTFARTS